MPGPGFHRAPASVGKARQQVSGQRWPEGTKPGAPPTRAMRDPRGSRDPGELNLLAIERPILADAPHRTSDRGTWTIAIAVPQYFQSDSFR